MIETEEILIFCRNLPTILTALCIKVIFKGKFNTNSGSNLNIANLKLKTPLYHIYYEDTFSNYRF
jgi:hypothetical protein